MISVVPSLTNYGMSLLIRSVSGEEQIVFTRFKLGDGELATGQSADELNDLISVKHAFAINSIEEAEDEGFIKITGAFNSADIDEDFTWRELGLFAHGDDDEDEVLYAYANSADDASTLRKLSGDLGTEQTIILYVAVGEATNVTAIVSPSEQYASKALFEAHVANTSNPHGLTKSQLGLGNVLNYAPKNAPITFSPPAQNTELVSGETVGTLFGKLAKIASSFISHLTASNPHSVGKSDVGLGNVPNLAPTNMTISFTEAEQNQSDLDSDDDLFTGSTLGTLFGRVAKAVHTLLAHIGTTTGNPHNVGANDVGLGSFDGLTPSIMKVEFTTNQNNAVPAASDTMSQIMGKLARCVTDFIDPVDTTQTVNPHGVKLGQIAAIGTYTGNGAQTGGRTIATSYDGVAFSPSAVQGWDEFGRTDNAATGVCGGLALSDRGVRVPNSLTADDATTWDDSFTALMCVTGGFKVNFYPGATAEDSIDTNETGVVYHYIAYK